MEYLETAPNYKLSREDNFKEGWSATLILNIAEKRHNGVKTCAC